MTLTASDILRFFGSKMKRKLTRFAALMGLGAIVLLACWVGLLVYIRQTTQSPPLPNPNGYDDLAKAGQAITTKPDGPTALDHDALGAWVRTNSESLKLVRVGLARQCAIPTEAAITNFTLHIPQVIPMKAVAILLTAEGRLAEMENRPSDAARSYVDAIRLGMEISRGGFLIHRLIGIACEGVGGAALAKLIPQLNCDQMRPLVAELEQIEGNAVTWREVVKSERRFERAQLASYRNPIALIGDWWQSRGAIKNSEEKHILAKARLRLLMTELALRSYRCVHENTPLSLEQLVPHFLQTIPSDPFAKGPLTYRPAGTNWVLYSVGIDHIDDNGKPVSGKSNVSQKSPGDLLYDSQW